MGRSRYKFLEKQPHFLTCTVVNWLPIFSQPELAQIIISSLDFLQNHQRLSLHGYVIVENHLHLIASAENLSKEIAAFKSFTARSIIDYLEEMIFPLVRKPASTEIILNLEKLSQENEESSDRNNSDRERVAKESVSTDDGKDEAIEGNVLPFDKRQ